MRQNNFLRKFLFLILAIFVFVSFSFVCVASSGQGSITITVPANFNGGVVQVTVQGKDTIGNSVPPATITLNINAAVSPISVSLTASPSSMTLPTNSTTLTWTTTGSPTSCTASGSWSGSKAAGGSTQTMSSLAAGTYAYSLTCSKTGTPDATASASVVVNAATSMSGTLTVPSCTIASGNSSCNVTISWSTTNPVATSAVTSSYPTADTLIANGNSGSQSVSVPYSSRTFYLYNNSVQLATSSAASNCVAGTAWNGSICSPCSLNQGNSCLSSPNSCGQTNSGIIGCDGSCSATPPPDSSCGPICGDNIITSPEVCDYGTNNGACPSGCSSSCAFNTCSGSVCGATHYNCSAGILSGATSHTLNWTWSCGIALCQEQRPKPTFKEN
jgi:hypothetical protein